MFIGGVFHREDLVRTIGGCFLLCFCVVLAQDDCYGLLTGLVGQLSRGVEQFQADAGGFAVICLNKYPNIFVFRKIHHRWPP